MNENSMIDRKNLDTIEKRKRELNKVLKSFFTGEITLNFMLEVMYAMLDLYPNIGNYIQEPADIGILLSGRKDNLFYILCQHIIGVHRSKTIFLSDEERSKLEDDREYKIELTRDVYNEIKLRPFIDPLIRNNQLIKGDRFLLFPVTYYIAVLEFHFLDLCSKSTEMPVVYTNIANRSLAVLSLLQDNVSECAYSTCRTIIEDYIKGEIFHNCKPAMVEYSKFASYELKQSLRNEFDQEFLEKFNNRICKNCKKKIDYLHYGWVDSIPGYHDIIKEHPYSFGAIKKFIVEKFPDDEGGRFYDLLSTYHNMCHGYAHGSIGYAKYPIIHYFQISSILVNTTVNAFFGLCRELGIESIINDVDLLAEVKKHYKILKEAESKRCLENYEKYYKNFNTH